MQKTAVWFLLMGLFCVACVEPAAETTPGSAQLPSQSTTSSQVTLSRPGEVAGASVGNQFLFVNYATPTIPAVVDLYDFSTGIQSSASLSESRTYISTATIGNKVFMVGGFNFSVSPGAPSSTIDIYDGVTGNWSTQTLLTARMIDQVAVVGTKLLVPGGFAGGSNALSSFEVIDTSNWTKVSKSLSVGRHNMAAVAVGSKAYFIGGMPCWLAPVCPPSNTIDIYDANTDTLSTITMPHSRTHHKAVVNGTKIYIGAGADGTHHLDVVDILETSDNTWTSTTTTARGQSATAGSVGQYVFFAGGSSSTSPYSDTISVLDVNTGIWSELNMSFGRYNMGTAILNNRAYLAGGDPSSGGNTDLIEVLDFSNQSISIFETED
jgi:hypothetical protein